MIEISLKVHERVKYGKINDKNFFGGWDLTEETKFVFFGRKRPQNTYFDISELKDTFVKTSVGCVTI